MPNDDDVLSYLGSAEAQPVTLHNLVLKSGLMPDELSAALNRLVSSGIVTRSISARGEQQYELAKTKVRITPPAGGPKRAYVSYRALEPGHRVGNYEVVRTLGQGGFGITYEAQDLYLDRRIALKEYFPAQWAVRGEGGELVALSEEREAWFRSGYQRFLEEGKTLAQLEHPNIVRVYAMHEENGTCYMVMHYAEGTSLEKDIGASRYGDDASLRTLLFPLMDGLAAVHDADFIHCDIKPSNIYLTEGGEPLLLDFGAARFAPGEEGQSEVFIFTEGYAALEQYPGLVQAEQGPATDIYALAATIFHLVTGEHPPPATSRAEAQLGGRPDPLPSLAVRCPGQFSDTVVKAVSAGLQLLPKARPENIAKWRALFSDEDRDGVALASAGANDAANDAPRGPGYASERALEGHESDLGSTPGTLGTLGTPGTLGDPIAEPDTASFADAKGRDGDEVALGDETGDGIDDEEIFPSLGKRWLIAGFAALVAAIVVLGVEVTGVFHDEPSYIVTPLPDQLGRVPTPSTRQPTPPSSTGSDSSGSRDDVQDTPTHEGGTSINTPDEPGLAVSETVPPEPSPEPVNDEAGQDTDGELNGALPVPVLENTTVLEATPLDASSPPGPVESPAEQIERLLGIAGEHFDASPRRLTLPHGNNAHETYLAVLALDPANVAAAAGITEILEWYVERAQSSFEEGRYTRVMPYVRRGRGVRADPRFDELEARLTQARTPEPIVAPAPPLDPIAPEIPPVVTVSATGSLREGIPWRIKNEAAHLLTSCTLDVTTAKDGLYFVPAAGRRGAARQWFGTTPAFTSPDVSKVGLLSPTNGSALDPWLTGGGRRITMTFSGFAPGETFRFFMPIESEDSPDASFPLVGSHLTGATLRCNADRIIRLVGKFVQHSQNDAVAELTEK